MIQRVTGQQREVWLDTWAAAAQAGVAWPEGKDLNLSLPPNPRNNC